MKIICLYLPQFHRFQENDEWWGEGFTDWVSSRNAVPLFKGHRQPRIPKDKNYYDLSDESARTWKWQADLANEFGIDGFCIYHYWLSGKLLMEKPMEILLKHKEINIHYAICWANGDWARTWYGTKKEMLLKQEYGNENMWKQHFMYMLQFFKDERYIKIANKPIINIYRTYEISCLTDMKRCWDRLAIENGFAGIYIISGNMEENIDINSNVIDAYYNFEPGHVFGSKRNKLYFKVFVWWKAKLINQVSKITGHVFFENKRSLKRVYKLILSEKVNKRKKVYLGICTEFDDTPRRREGGIVYGRATPRLFEKALYNLLKKSENIGSEFVYINAWNEWGESAYLEPDEKYGYQYLESVKRAKEKYEQKRYKKST